MQTKVVAKGNDGKAVISFKVGGHPTSSAILRELRRWSCTPTTHQITITYTPRNYVSK
ncbi:MAG: hypothetical protein J6U49_02600 [Alistipes sp.]|nr:hypothetical protein [Alistipes sp.]